MTLSEKIQKLRKEKGLSQDQLALELNVSRQSVSKWELGDSMPDIPKILQLADFFQVTTDYLLREEQENPSTPPAADLSFDGGKAKRSFLRAAKIAVTIMILCILLGVIAMLVSASKPALGGTELALMLLSISMTITPAAGILAIIFWILYHFKK